MTHADRWRDGPLRGHWGRGGGGEKEGPQSGAPVLRLCTQPLPPGLGGDEGAGAA